MDEVTEGVEGTQNLKATNSHSSLLLSITTNLKFWMKTLKVLYIYLCIELYMGDA